MPSFRGIEVSIITQSLIGRLPEYAHPDGSCYQEPDASEICQDGQQAIGEAERHDPTCDMKASPKISVYIPSLPGAQFWIRYNVEREPSPSSHLFFKLHMNGRHITSWGINPRIKSKGQVEKALYEPSDRWNQEDNGVVFKPEGIEARYFYFVSDQQKLSIADEGGLIEVHVFRAKGRKRRAARLDQYRQMDKYGIATASGGLVDNPQDVTFFDFHLIDPKDKPFATFRFHYRSLTNLYQLNLIPTDDPNTLFPSPTGTARQVIDTISKGSFTIWEDASCMEDQTESGRHEPDESVFDDSTSSFPQVTPLACNTKPRRNSSYILRSPPQLRPRSISSSYHVPQPSKIIRDGLPPGFPDSYLTRPLPDLPTDGPSDTCASRPRKYSTSSATPSIAPSLLSYVNNESYAEEDVRYGQAVEVAIDKDHPGVPLTQERTLSTLLNDSARVDVSTPLGASDSSLSNYEVSPMTTNDSKEHDPVLLSPVNYMATTGSTLEKDIGQISSGKETHSPSDIDSPRIKRVDTGALALDLARFPHLKLSESDWIRKTPSPEHVPRRILSPRLGRLWNTLRRNKSRSPMRKTRKDASPHNYSTPELPGPEEKEKRGNWI